MGMVVLIACALQFTAWKTHHLACCRDAQGCGSPYSPGPGTAWRDGLRLGVHCIYCCVGLTAVLLVIGVMDFRVMSAIAAATTVERLTSNGERSARAIGGVLVGAGLLLTARALIVV